LIGNCFFRGAADSRSSPWISPLAHNGQEDLSEGVESVGGFGEKLGDQLKHFEKCLPSALLFDIYWS
jgi:hypothetical protein